MDNTDEREKILAEIKRIANKKGVNTLSRNEFSSLSGISLWKIYKYFNGWNEVITLAGLKPNYQGLELRDEELFDEMLNVFTQCGTVCSAHRFRRLSKHDSKIYKKRFGEWIDVLKAFKQWVLHKNIHFEYFGQLPSDNEIKIGKNIDKGLNININHQNSGISNNKYGSFINFRGLQHSPINEQGVVFLFGMVCHELGYIVESIRSEFPDCEAKRRTDKNKDIWERVKIEFEYKSSNYKEHGHSYSKCDIIVCWQHDWNKCPIEVLELKSIIWNLK